MLEELLLTILSQYHTTEHTCCLCCIITTLQTIPTAHVVSLNYPKAGAFNQLFMNVRVAKPPGGRSSVGWKRSPDTADIVVAVPSLSHSTNTCSNAI